MLAFIVIGGLHFAGACACPSPHQGPSLARRRHACRGNQRRVSYLQRTITRSVPRKPTGRRVSGFKRTLLGAWGAFLLGVGALWAWDIRDLQLADYGVITGFVSAGAVDAALALAGRAPVSRRRFLTFKASVILLNLLAIAAAVGIVTVALHVA